MQRGDAGDGRDALCLADDDATRVGLRHAVANRSRQLAGELRNSLAQVFDDGGAAVASHSGVTITLLADQAGPDDVAAPALAQRGLDGNHPFVAPGDVQRERLDCPAQTKIRRLGSTDQTQAVSRQLFPRRRGQEARHVLVQRDFAAMHVGHGGLDVAQLSSARSRPRIGEFRHRQANSLAIAQ